MFVDIEVDASEVDSLLEKATAAAVKFDADGDRRKQSAALIKAASCNAFKQKHKEAMQQATEALDLCDTFGVQEAEPAALCVYARAQIALDGPGEALVTAKRALRHYQDLGSKKGEATGLTTIAIVQAARYAWAKHRAGFEYITEKGLREAETEMVSKAEDAAKIYRMTSDAKREASVWMTVMEAYSLKEDFQGACEASEMALELYKNCKAVKEQAATKLAIANLYMNEQKYDEVIPLAQEALEISLSIDDAAGEGDALSKMLEIYLFQGNTAKTVSTAKRMVSAYNRSGDPVKEADAKLAAAQALLSLNKPTEAGALAQEAHGGFMGAMEGEKMKIAEGTAKQAAQMINDVEINARWKEMCEEFNTPKKLYYGDPDPSWLNYDDATGVMKGVN